jgi:hypothetical protein
MVSGSESQSLSMPSQILLRTTVDLGIVVVAVLVHPVASHLRGTGIAAGVTVVTISVAGCVVRGLLTGEKATLVSITKPVPVPVDKPEVVTTSVVGPQRIGASLARIVGGQPTVGAVADGLDVASF